MTALISKRSLGFLILAAGFSASSFSQSTFEPDHYLTYEITANEFLPDSVTLRDQFIAPTVFNVIKPVRLLNPSIKYHHDQSGNNLYDVKNPKLHYTAFQLETSQALNINKSVDVSNQFGTWRLSKFRPERLLVPTIKKHLLLDDADNQNNSLAALAIGTGGGAVAVADHYLCYKIEEQQQIAGVGLLGDQFRYRKFDGLRPKHLCNPVAKKHKKQKFEIINNVDSNHLMCFELNKLPISRQVQLKNQFGNQNVKVTIDDELCVPSIKVDINTDLCEDSAAPTCGGKCQDTTQKCTQGAAGCHCQSANTDTCVGVNGMCSGSCNNGAICSQVPGTTDCRCP